MRITSIHPGPFLLESSESPERLSHMTGRKVSGVHKGGLSAAHMPLKGPLTCLDVP